MTPAKTLNRPKLVPHARYRWDKVRHQHQLVFPEGLLVLNETGAAVVQNCDGRPLDDLVDGLAASYEDCNRQEVTRFLAALYEKGLVRDASGA